MLKPKALKKGDKVAIVSLSSGLLGEPNFIHKLDIAKERLEKDFELEVVTMPNTLKGIKFLYEHPELRAKDLMDAFADKTIKAIFCAIGGEDTIRLLPYIDFEIIKNNPKIFMGFSDTTVNHFMCKYAGLNSFYGPAIMTDFAEYSEIFPYTKQAVLDILFNPTENHQIKPAGVVCNEFLPWGIENINKQRKLEKDIKGYELLQGKGVVAGELFGGCIDCFPYLVPTKLWPKTEEFEGKILILETSEIYPTPEYITFTLRGLGAAGIFDKISGILVGKPQQEKFYEEYKDSFKKVVGYEYNKPNLPILYNVNFGHGSPIGIIPLGCKAEINCKNKTLTLLEKPTEV